jgi:hypothetical protein
MSNRGTLPMPRDPYSGAVPRKTRHVEATTSLTLGGRLSEASHDPAGAGSTPDASGVLTHRIDHDAAAPTSPLPPSALRAPVAVDEPCRTPSRLDPMEIPVHHARSLADARSLVRARHGRIATDSHRTGHRAA